MTTTHKPTHGRHRVLTASGAIYVIDLDALTMIRTKPGPGVQDIGAEETPLIDIIECRVGGPLRLLVQLPLPGIVHTRWTSTPIVSIEEITDES